MTIAIEQTKRMKHNKYFYSKRTEYKKTMSIYCEYINKSYDLNVKTAHA